MIMLPGDCGLAADEAGAGAVSTVSGRWATRPSTGCKLVISSLCEGEHM